MGGFFDQFAPLNNRIDKDPLRKGLLNLGYPFFHRINDLVGIGILQHHDLTHDFFPFPVGRNGPEAVGASKAYSGNIPDQDRDPIGRGGDHRVFQVFQGGDQSVATDEETLVPLFYISTPCHTVVGFNG